jgi:CMP-N,N'-diacetyllegionaminic acid synthase
MKFLAIIPARKNSKRLKNKNLLPINGKPLICWTIEESLKSKYISNTLITSDWDEVITLAKEYNLEYIKRPNNLAKDDSTSEQLINHILETYTSINKYDYLVLLQPTSPLRTKDDIDNAIKKVLQENANSLISVYKYDNKILKAFIEKDGSIKGICNDFYPFQCKQSLPDVFMSNGAIYIVKIEDFIKYNSFYIPKVISYEMSEQNSIDIDTIEDLIIAENIMKGTEIGEK